MNDSLFLMQRYWGSDEEDEEQVKTNGSINLKVFETNHKSSKIQKLDSSIITEVIEKDSDIEVWDKTNGFESFETPTKKVQEFSKTSFEVRSSKSKRKSKNKKQCETDTFIQSQKSTLLDSQDDVCIVLNAPKNIATKDDFSENIEKQKKRCKLKTLNKPNENIEISQESNLSDSGEKSTLLDSEDDMCIVLNSPKNIATKNDSSENVEKQKKRHKQKILNKPNENIEISKESNVPDSEDCVSIIDNSPENSTETKPQFTNVEGKQKKKKKEKVAKENILKSTALPASTDGNFCTIGQIQHRKDQKVKQTLPNWLNNPTHIGVNLQEEETPISELNYLDSNIKKNLHEAGINFMFPVQLAVIPWLMQSKERCLLVRPSDICVSAPTGSGKTLAFVLPIVQSLKDRVVYSIRALVVLPVHELAIQVYKVFETFTRGTDLKVALLTGQKSFHTEQNVLVKHVGNQVQSLVDIVVTTPGRVSDHMLRTRGFCLKRLRYLVIDEADRMMEEIQQGWLKQVEEAVFQDCRFQDCVCLNSKRLLVEPSSAFNFGFICQPLQKLLYSATLTHDPEQLHSLTLYKPKLFTASSHGPEDEYIGTCAIPDKLTMKQIICDAGIKPLAICHLVKKHQFKKVLCFTESVKRAHRLNLVLEEMGLFHVREMSSFNRAVQRKIVLEQFVSGKINILICSDLVARGIDIEDIDCVISYDVPHFVKTYIHRIGRTARAGKSGTAITLLSRGEIPDFKNILKSAGIAQPKLCDINREDLKPLISVYQNALIAADTKLKNETSVASGKPLQKRKRKNIHASSKPPQKKKRK